MTKEEEQIRNKDFWNRLNALLKQNGVTQAKLSEQLTSVNTSERRLQNLSANNRLPDCYEVSQIADILNTTTDYLLFGKVENQLQSQAISILKKIPDNVMIGVIPLLDVILKNASSVVSVTES